MRAERWTTTLCWLLPLLTSVYVALFHHTAPYFDEWDLVPLFQSADSGQLTLEQVFTIHGGHWHAGAYTLLIPLAFATGWSHLAEVLASCAFMAATCVLLARMARRFASANALVTPAGLFALAAVFLASSLDQAANLTWGFQLSVFISNFGAVLCFSALTARAFNPGALALALAGFAISITSYATGFALAPIGLALIAMRGETAWRWRIASMFVWAAACGAWLALFFMMLKTAPYGGGAALAALQHPGAMTTLGLFLAQFIGAGVARTSTSLIFPMAALSAVAGAALSVHLWRKTRRIEPLIVPLALIAFALGAGLLCGLGRIEFGFRQGANGRYFSFANFYWIGFALLALAALPDLPKKTWARRGLYTLVIVAGLLKISACVQMSAKATRVSREVAAVSATIRDDPARAVAAARTIAFERQDVAADLEFLRRKGWSMFRGRAGTAANPVAEPRAERP